MIFFSLFSTAISSIFYGIIVTVTVMALLYLVLRSVSEGIVHTPVFFITGVVLAVLLSIQSSLLIGALEAKNAADAAELYLNQMLEGSQGVIGARESQQVMDALTEEFPLIGTYASLADFSGNDMAELPGVVHDTLTDYLNSFIWHRVWWSLTIIFVACLVVMLYDKRAMSASAGKSARKVRVTARKKYNDF